MAKNPVVTKIDSVSKAEEVAWLIKVANKIGDNTYLKTLFSPKMIDWFSYAIQIDFAPDLLGEMDAFRTKWQNAQQAERDAINEWQTKYLELEAKYDKRTIEYTEIFNSMEDKLKACEEMSMVRAAGRDQAQNERDEYQTQMLKERKEWSEAYDKVSGDFHKANADLMVAQSEVEALKTRVLELKAELYDVIMAQH